MRKSTPGTWAAPHLPKYELDSALHGLNNVPVDVRSSIGRVRRLSEGLSSLGADSTANINQLTALCGELLGASCALFNRIQGGLLCSLGQWAAPPDYVAQDKPEGHICFDVIQRDSDDPLLIRQLQATPYAHSDPNVRAYGLQTYLGIRVRSGGVPIGSLCVVYVRDVVPTEEDLQLLSLLAVAVGNEDRRKDVEDALRQARVFQRTLVENIPDLVWMKDAQGRYLSCNPAFCRLYGAAEADIVGKTDYDFVSREEADFFRGRDRMAADARKSLSNEEWLTFADGSRGCFETIKTPVFDTDGALLGVLGVARDITSRHQVEESLREGRRTLSTILDNLPLRAWMKDREGRFLAVNQLFAAACGHASPDEVIGKTDADVWPAHLAERFRSDDEKVMQTGEKLMVEEPREVGGALQWFETYKVPLRNGRGEVTGTVGFARDITERKEAEATQARQVDELRRWYAVTLGREKRVLELKMEVNARARELGRPPPYAEPAGGPSSGPA